MRIINKVIKSENLMANLSSMFGTTFRRDWIGRIYTVINPLVQLKPEDLVYEYNTNGTSLDSTVNKFVMDRMVAADKFIINHELFDLLTHSIQQVDDDYNFLFVMTPIAWVDLRNSLKTFMWWLLGAVVAGLAALGGYIAYINA